MQGDSGGPVHYIDPMIGRSAVIGITSWGGKCAVENQPGVYTKVANYLPWIEEKTGN